jgi:hypothetical protein
MKKVKEKKVRRIFTRHSFEESTTTKLRIFNILEFKSHVINLESFVASYSILSQSINQLVREPVNDVVSSVTIVIVAKINQKKVGRKFSDFIV